MTCEDFTRIIDSWTDTGEADPSAPALARDHADRCRTCGVRYAALLILMERETGERPFPAEADAPGGSDPELFTARVMDSISGRETHGRKPPRRLWIPAAAAAAAILAVVVGRAALAPPDLVVEFRLTAPGARTVTVVGDFNGWDPAVTKLGDRDGDGVWTGKVSLKRGAAYSYNFVIDDSDWVPDPDALLQVKDGFGGLNSVLKL